jgi:hypothetical protein
MLIVKPIYIFIGVFLEVSLLYSVLLGLDLFFKRKLKVENAKENLEYKKFVNSSIVKEETKVEPVDIKKLWHIKITMKNGIVHFFDNGWNSLTIPLSFRRFYTWFRCRKSDSYDFTYKKGENFGISILVLLRNEISGIEIYRDETKEI